MIYTIGGALMRDITYATLPQDGVRCIVRTKDNAYIDATAMRSAPNHFVKFEDDAKINQPITHWAVVREME